MPPSSVTEILVDSIVTSVNAVIPLLNELHDGLCPPFVQAISNTAVSLMHALQNAKRNKEECCQLTENIHGIIYVIVNLHLQSEPPGCLALAMMDHVGQFTETLHKILAFVQAQQDNSKIKHFFRQNQLSALLKDCRAGLQLALDNFARKARNMHAEVLELISNLSDSTISDQASSIQISNKSQASSLSVSLLPSMPQIFHGHESEVTQVVQMLSQQCARIAILGPGGIGKTNLARAVLHHPAVAAKYEDCLFVSCESATTSVEIAGLIGAHLGLKPGKDLTKSVLRSLAKKSICLLVLDNLETTWEPLKSCSGTEDLLSSLTDIPHLALMVTMRGAEHPAKVRWTRPFLPALAPLSLEAAQQMFIVIAEDYHEPKDVDQLLKFTDNMPLAVDLMAHLVAFEGCSPVLARLQTEKTSVLSEGSDKQSNLDKSIALSLSSPRFTAQSRAMDLLQLLSILPDGLSDVELIQSNLGIPQIRACKSVLIGTSLAYVDDKKRLKSLVPIREYLQHFHPVLPASVLPLQTHFQSLLQMFRKYNGSTQVTNIVRDITLNLGNIHQVLSRALTPQNPDLVEAIRCTCWLDGLCRSTGHGSHPLMGSIQDILPPNNHKAAVLFATGALMAGNHSIIVEDRELLASQAKAHCQALDDPALETDLYRALGGYYCWFTDNRLDEGMQCFERALRVARDTGDIRAQCLILLYPALLNWRMGKYTISQALADEMFTLGQLCGHCYMQAEALRVKSICAQSLGNLKNSLSLLEVAKELLGLCGMSRGVLDLQLRMNTGSTHMDKSEYDDARTIYTQVASEMSVEQEQCDFAITLLNIATIDVAIGASKQDVLQNLEMGKTILSSLGHFTGTIYYELVLSGLELREGELLTAKIRFEKCLQWSWTRHTEVSFNCLEKMADINCWGAANFDWAAAFGIIYLAFVHQKKQKLGLYKALYNLGNMFLINKDKATAESLFTVALEAFTEMDVHQWRTNCMLQLGDIAAQQGYMSGAERHWRDARPLFEKSLQAKDMANIDLKLASIEKAHEGALAMLAQLQAPTQSLT
ncbi:hypothetical protein C8R45DRAFT_1163461 [Mycena sanguinolenta]|nr:hypothetical protein C8R45DRAFT_1163461 [Mycena sanguinolenta]